VYCNTEINHKKKIRFLLTNSASMESAAIKVSTTLPPFSLQAQEACAQGDEALYRGKWAEALVKYTEATSMLESAMSSADQPTQLMLQKQIDRCKDKTKHIQQYLESSTSIHVNDGGQNWDMSEISPLTEYQSLHEESLGPLPFGLHPGTQGRTNSFFPYSSRGGFFGRLPCFVWYF
jgi:hypothetical protein